MAATKKKFLKWQENNQLAVYSGTIVDAKTENEKMYAFLDKTWAEYWVLYGAKKRTIRLDKFEVLLRKFHDLRMRYNSLVNVSSDLHRRGNMYLKSMYMRRKKRPDKKDIIGDTNQKPRKITL